jgi:threonine dehydratase
MQVLACEEINKHAGRCILLKAECLQVTGSFKIRGASNAVQLFLQEHQGSSPVAGVYTHRSVALEFQAVTAAN